VTDGFVTMAYAMLVAIALVYLLVVILFSSLLVPLVILYALLLAVFGAFVALAATGRALNLSALIVLLMLRSIVVTNAIVLLVERDRSGILEHVALVPVTLLTFLPQTLVDRILQPRQENADGIIFGATVHDPPHSLLVPMLCDTLICRQARYPSRSQEPIDEDIQRMPSLPLLQGAIRKVPHHELGGVSGALERAPIAAPEAQSVHSAGACPLVLAPA
jgi:hypothetical protein